MPTYLQHTSSMLVHNKKHRTVFICGVISLMTLTSLVGVLTCPITVRPYPEVMVLERQQQQQQISAAPLPVPEKLTATTTGSSLDQLILTFLEAALSDESAEGRRAASSSTKENNTLEGAASNIELKLTRVMNGREVGRSRREFFRFYRSVERMTKPLLIEFNLSVRVLRSPAKSFIDFEIKKKIHAPRETPCYTFLRNAVVGTSSITDRKAAGTTDGSRENAKPAFLSGGSCRSPRNPGLPERCRWIRAASSTG